jgi:hypothetical protein
MRLQHVAWQEVERLGRERNRKHRPGMDVPVGFAPGQGVVHLLVAAVHRGKALMCGKLVVPAVARETAGRIRSSRLDRMA